MAPYHGIITAGLRNNRQYVPKTLPNPPLHYKSPVKHLQKLDPPVVLSFPGQRDMMMPSNHVSRNLPGIHHQARERGNPRIDFWDIFGSSFEHADDPEKLSEAGQWVFAVINSLEETQYCLDPFGIRIREMGNPLSARIDDMLVYGSAGNQQMENLAAQQILHLLQAISDILLEDRRLGVFDGSLFYEFIETALYLTPIISHVLGGAGVLMLLRAVVLMSGHDVGIIKELIRTIPFPEQQALIPCAHDYWNLERKQLGRLLILIFAGVI
ncbi:hypothetical protein DSL72_005860 [Monilinia vaccinii-corymbosi]|uniref:Uncharacterized protein n=1 Tax=Monilinia vaccinii-corymbosi TaxID=61207 RepID=A0A8A3PGT1_9HELO|nr:hypothetical protein DSL72_005860 [Monilinia vaccinii-corymbosi]